VSSDLPEPKNLPPLKSGYPTGLCYIAPVIGIPAAIVIAIAFDSTLAKFILLLSFILPPLTFVMRSYLYHNRRRLYVRYRRYASFVNELGAKLFGFSSTRIVPLREQMSPHALAIYETINNKTAAFPKVDLSNLMPEHLAASEAAMTDLLAYIAPDRSLDSDLSDLPAKVADIFIQDRQTYIPTSIQRIAAYQSFLTAVYHTLLCPIGGSLPQNLANKLNPIDSAWQATSQELGNIRVMHLNNPPASMPPHELESFYRTQLEAYFYGQWDHLKNAQALGRNPLVPETRNNQYVVSDLSPDVQAYERAMEAASQHHLTFATVTQNPDQWLSQFQALSVPLLAEFNQHLATSGQFILGTTANAQQPDITSAPPYAVTLTPIERRSHTYVIGRTGSGKTTLLKNLITQDLRNPTQGVIVLSPENKIFEELLDLLPSERADSLIYFDPTDTRPPVIGFNPFTFEDGDDLNQKAQETYTIFERALGELGVKMTTMLQNAAYALIQLKNSRLLDLDTLLNPSNNSLRYKVARDPAIDERTRNFWQNYDSSSYYKSAYEPVVNRLDPFFRPPHATILSTNSFSWDDVLNKKPHIILCNLSRLKGMEAQIMGQLLIAQIQQTIFHRDPLPESTYIPYALYVDEFQTYATTGEQSFIETLNKARKYHFALTLAHQVTSDIPPKLLSSIVGNVGTVIALRTSAEDAPFFAKDLQIKDADGHSRPDLLQNLPIGQAIVRTPAHNIGIAIGVPPAPPPLARATPAPSLPKLADTYAATLKMLSKRNFGTQPTHTATARHCAARAHFRRCSSPRHERRHRARTGTDRYRNHRD
jgi:Type IV secretion-system coupling protein DNA-binding domain